MENEDVVDQMLYQLIEEKNTDIIFKVLAHCNINNWKQKNIRLFIEIVRKIVVQDYDRNILILSYNPILTLSLCGEYLSKLMSTFYRFRLP